MNKIIMVLVMVLMMTGVGCLTVTYKNVAHIVEPEGTVYSKLDIELDLKPGE